MVNANDDLSKLESIAGSKTNVDLNKRVDFFFNTLATDIKQDCFKKNKKKQTSQIDVVKHTKLFYKIFDYIYVVCC